MKTFCLSFKMKAYHLKFTQSIPISMAEAWNFFSSPHNLVMITPDEMAFKVTSGLSTEQKMYSGQIITYTVSPMLGIKIDWMTEITHIEEGKYFIDEQRFGPYKFWHHQHHFSEVPGGVKMDDILTYGLSLGILGQAANQLFVANKLQEIFSFREEKITEIFGKL